jgi:DNA (cytosine-5)-methyltransferase 1
MPTAENVMSRMVDKTAESNSWTITRQLTVVDLCAGAGGVTAGYKAAGLRVVAAADLDPNAIRSYAANHPEVATVMADLLKIAPAQFKRRAGLRTQPDVLTICAPCQTFSTMSAKNRRANDKRNHLVRRVVSFVDVLKPRCVVMENVPQLVRQRRFKTVVGQLRKRKYGVWFGIVDAAHFGVPQTRRRLVLIAIRGLKDHQVPALTPDHPLLCRRVARRTVRQVLDGLVRLRGDKLHTSRKYSSMVARRIAAIPHDGGNRHSLPTHLQLKCHKRNASKTACGNVYGRMQWDDVAPTLTTRCTTPACGRFLHPQKNRAITLREAACIQTFARNYVFEGGYVSKEAQIGNAVPPKLARAIGLLITAALAKSKRRSRKVKVRQKVRYAA